MYAFRGACAHRYTHVHHEVSSLSDAAFALSSPIFTKILRLKTYFESILGHRITCNRYCIHQKRSNCFVWAANGFIYWDIQCENVADLTQVLCLLISLRRSTHTVRLTFACNKRLQWTACGCHPKETLAPLNAVQCNLSMHTAAMQSTWLCVMSYSPMHPTLTFNPID